MKTPNRKFSTWPRVLVLGGLILAGLPQAGHAQVATLQSAQLARLCADGSYDLAIQNADRWIKQARENGQRLDPFVIYWRGCASFKIGWFGRAQSDLEKVLQAGLAAPNMSVQKMLHQIEGIKAVLPPEVEEVKKGGKTIFRVYYTQKDKLTTDLIESLPLAYQVTGEMFGADVAEQLVIIFDTAEQMRAYKTVRGYRMTSYSTAFGGADGFYICLETRQGKPLQRTAKAARGTVAHEYNHCVFLRTMGTAKMSRWFVEGLAECAKEQAMNGDGTALEKRMALLIKRNKLIAPELLEDSRSFTDQTEASVARLHRHPNAPYTQGHSMTRFLLSKLDEGQLPAFLNKAREARSLDGALQSELGLTLSDFYGLWFKDARAKARQINQGLKANRPLKVEEEEAKQEEEAEEHEAREHEAEEDQNPLG